MQKHLSFWLGVFISLIVFLPVVFGIIGASEEKLLNSAVFLFGFICSLLLLLVLLLFFRDKVVTRIFGTTISSIDEIADNTHSLAKSIVAKDPVKISQYSTQIARQIATYYSWGNLYRWVVGTALALLVGFAGFAGTLLLFEQNKKLGEQTVQLKNQNDTAERQFSLFQLQTDLLEAQTSSIAAQIDLESLQLTDSVRGLLARDTNVHSARVINVKNAECPFSFPTTNNEYYRKPNRSVMTQLENIMAKDTWNDQLIDSLQVLLSDDNSGVVLSALQMLEFIGIEPKERTIQLDQIEINNLDLTSDIELIIKNSIVSDFSCKNCRVLVENSIVDKMLVEDAEIRDSVVYLDEINPVETKNSIVVVDSTLHSISIFTLFNSAFKESGKYGSLDNLIIGIRLDNRPFIRNHPRLIGEPGDSQGCEYIRKMCNSTSHLSCADT